MMQDLEGYGRSWFYRRSNERSLDGKWPDLSQRKLNKRTARKQQGYLLESFYFSRREMTEAWTRVVVMEMKRGHHI